MVPSSRLRRPKSELLALIGPWPLQPIPVSIFGWALLQFGYTLELRIRGEVSWLASLQAAQYSLPAGLTLFATLWLLRFLKQRGVFGEVGIGRYLLILVIGNLPSSILTFALIGTELTDAPFLLTRNLFFLVLIQALLGITEQRLRSEIAEKERSLELLAEQRELIIEADEAARRSIADFLHDRVQANMVVLSMQLNQIADEAGDGVGTRLRSITDELERLRKFDLRSASQRLSPDLRIIGLQGALDDLQKFYSSVMEIEVQLDPSFRDVQSGDHEYRDLCAYRIIEQALLNAAVHGKAKRCRVAAEVRPGGGWRIDVRNDGAPLVDGRQPGAGSAIIDAWAHSLSGQWRLINEDGWVRLTVTFSE